MVIDLKLTGRRVTGIVVLSFGGLGSVAFVCHQEFRPFTGVAYQITWLKVVYSQCIS